MSHYDDDLGHLIRVSLSGLADEAKPSAEVWARIEEQIKKRLCDYGCHDCREPESPPPPFPASLQLTWPGVPLIRL
jgi:hypothetical protein